MLKIRLTRIGKRNKPEFRLVLQEAKTAVKSGRSIEILGYYNPRKKEQKVEKERVNYWISQGVQISPSAYNILVGNGVIKGPTQKMKIKIKKKAGEAVAAEAAPAAASAAPAKIETPAAK